jgi:hypothetical protein
MNVSMDQTADGKVVSTLEGNLTISLEELPEKK